MAPPSAAVEWRGPRRRKPSENCLTQSFPADFPLLSFSVVLKILGQPLRWRSARPLHHFPLFHFPRRASPASSRFHFSELRIVPRRAPLAARQRAICCLIMLFNIERLTVAPRAPYSAAGSEPEKGRAGMRTPTNQQGCFANLVQSATTWRKRAAIGRAHCILQSVADLRNRAKRQFCRPPVCDCVSLGSVFLTLYLLVCSRKPQLLSVVQ